MSLNKDRVASVFLDKVVLPDAMGLSKENLNAIDVPGDGNCLYHSVALLTEGVYVTVLLHEIIICGGGFPSPVK